MTDKQIGYSLIFLTLGLTGAVAIFFAWESYNPRHPRTLRFSEVGSLSVQDPVRMKGTLVGEIVGFEHDDSGRVLVFIRSPEPIPIRASSYVAVKVKGVMGERFIEIDAGDPADPLIPEDLIVDGHFEMGPSEAIVYMDLLHDKINELRDIMLWLRDGRDDGKRPFIVAFNDIVGTVDTLAHRLLTTMVEMEDGLSEGLEKAAELTQTAIRVTSEVAEKGPKLMSDLNTVMEKLDGLIPQMEKVFADVEKIAGVIDTNSLLWGDHLERLQRLLPEIRVFADSIRNDGLPLNVRLRFFRQR
jgi:phospholipid/cholesterol/gamma-HCH transport system substrate-binding protein